MNIAYKKKYIKENKEFTQWIQVGKLFKHDDGGMTININSVPVGFDGNLSVFTNRKKEATVEKEQEIPF